MGILGGTQCCQEQHPERCLRGVSADRDCVASLPALPGGQSGCLYDPHGDYSLRCPGRDPLLPAPALQSSGAVRIVCGDPALLLVGLLHRSPLPDSQVCLAALWRLPGLDQALQRAVAPAGRAGSWCRAL